jgi:hypothetical protein
MLPSPWDSRPPGSVGLVVLSIAIAIGSGCSSAESFRGRGRDAGASTGLAGASATTGSGGVAGAPATTGTGGADPIGSAGSSGAAGDLGTNGAAGTMGVAGAGGSSVAGASGVAGSGGIAGTGGPGGSGAAGTGAAGSTGGTGSAGSVGSTGAAGTAPPPPPPPPGAVALPFSVSDQYAPSGAMGDGMVAGAITTVIDPAACTGEPAAAKAGACYTITYKPQLVAPATGTWGGVFWQFPDGNWGTTQGKQITPGATAVSFYAKGMVGGEQLTFKAGGIVNTVSSTTPYTDTFTAQTPGATVMLTKTWTKYSIPMTGMTYDRVLGGFCWVAAATNTTPITFNLHGIVWEK